MIENALRISLGKNFDHTEYCVWLADNAPNYGVLVRNHATLEMMRSQKRLGKWKHSNLSKQIQLKLLELDVDTQVLVFLNASQFSTVRIQRIMRAWPSDKPVLFIG